MESYISLYNTHKENKLFHRYIHSDDIVDLLQNLGHYFQVKTIGHSALGKPIYGVKVGNGKKRVLLWSQMHGNESTTTKALFDVFNTLKWFNDFSSAILNECELYIIPILNPDGAFLYTRVNANNIDLNRDAQDLSQPESVVLSKAFNEFKPHYCFNLHGQRTIFSAGNVDKPATVSFLSPAQDKATTVTYNRKVAMHIIVQMNKVLQQMIPGQVGVYDDSFNINCVGDTFQNKGIPTVLFEAGHFHKDYEREQTRKYIYIALFVALKSIAKGDASGEDYKAYFDIPENQKLFYDIIIRNAKLSKNSQEYIDLAVLYKEVLFENKIKFVPIIENMGKLNHYYGHREIDAQNQEVKLKNGAFKIGDEIDIVTIGGKDYSFNL